MKLVGLLCLLILKIPTGLKFPQRDQTLEGEIQVLFIVMAKEKILEDEGIVNPVGGGS